MMASNGFYPYDRIPYSKSGKDQALKGVKTLTHWAVAAPPDKIEVCGQFGSFYSLCVRSVFILAFEFCAVEEKK
jgi:hypothetical protein